jgi:ADP-ribose pyrophosphatase YjhB (NUDIX family)
MIKSLLAAVAAAAALSVVPHAAGAADLTALEKRWLLAAYPVLEYARAQSLPIDIIVQPQARASDVPLAAGFDGGRCKLVLSLRGNPDAEAQLAGVAPEQQGELIEAMAAHEIGHCWRYAQGAWHALPAGFVEAGEETADDPALLAASKAMRETRREEGYADLVALAWTRHSHPAAYGRVYAWLERLRQDPPVAHSGHDTRAWVALARDGARFGAASKPFEDAAPLWREGLLSDE